MSTVIKIEHLSKKYVIEHQKQEKYIALRDVIAHKIRGIGQRLLHPLSPNKEETNLEEFWALKDINLEIKQGDRVGIIGRNGAGKSTLLKILSRITEPTTGRITINGRVASLLEVGTGFHPELTGRENIFLNGAILGMSRVEIKKKFEEIIEFAEIENFLDTPVKRYSSGMYVRLAFAVAAHLEPEILLVDEVLAVGDASFQKKCLGKMKDAEIEGRTIIFVSHQLDIIQRLCNKSVLLQAGNLISQGTTKEIIQHYLSKTNLCASFEETCLDNQKPMQLRAVRLISENSFSKSQFFRNESARVEVLYDINKHIKNVHIVCHFVDNLNRVILSTGDCDITGNLDKERIPGTYKAFFELPTSILNEGEYSLTFALGVPYIQNYDRIVDTVKFKLTDIEKNSGPGYIQARPGAVIQDIEWRTKRTTNNN